MSRMWICFLTILPFALCQEVVSPYVFSDCKHLILPPLCQCYHSGHESQLRCLRSQLHSLPKLPNNMRWDALDFSFNYITSVDSYVFADIYVEKINLRSNYLRGIEPTAFDQIKNLKQLYISHNQLKGLHPQALSSPGSSLEIFDVSHNSFHYLDIGQILINLPMLKEFHLVACNLSNVSIYTLSNLTGSITNEHNQTVARTGHYHLEILDLSHNNLTSICSNLFDGLYNLIELRLEHNFIRLVDNNFLRSFQQIKSVNLAHNALEHVPRLASRSLEVLNFSSNHIHYIGDYFASNLRSIRTIDFDHNHHLNSTSTRAFCFLNILSLEKVSFRANNLLSLSTFGELLCRLSNQTQKGSIIDINHNTNLKCNCTLIQFQTYLSKYSDLTCTHQGQDRYYISKLSNWFANCPMDFCLTRQRQTQTNYCNEGDAERVVYEGTCQAKLAASEERKRMRNKSTPAMVTLMDHSKVENITDRENSTRIQIEKSQTANGLSLSERSTFVWLSCVLILLL